MLNKIFTVIILTIVTVVGFFMYKEQDIGYLRVSFSSFQYETNLLAVLTAALLLLFASLVLRLILIYLVGVCSWFGSKRHVRLAEKATRSMMLGYTELAAGRFKEAEKHLLIEIKHNENATLAYLGAARAAQQLHAQERRDKHLLKAHGFSTDTDTAILLTKAELLVANKQNELALATLSMLAEESPGNILVLNLLATVYQRLADWNSLQLILPELKKSGAVPADDIATLEALVWEGLLKDASTEHDGRSLARLWSIIPRAYRQDPEMVSFYAQLLLDTGADEEAEQILRECLNQGWDEALIELYSTIDVITDNKQLEAAQSWLQKHPNDVHLLLALGNLCTGRSLWGKARGYYEASISVMPTPENCLRLAKLLEHHMDEANTAQRYYRQGLRLISPTAESTNGPRLLEHIPGDESGSGSTDLKTV